MQFCVKCGTELEDSDLFCTECGQRVEEDPVPTFSPGVGFESNKLQQNFVRKSKMFAKGLSDMFGGFAAGINEISNEIKKSVQPQSTQAGFKQQTNTQSNQPVQSTPTSTAPENQQPAPQAAANRQPAVPPPVPPQPKPQPKPQPQTQRQPEAQPVYAAQTPPVSDQAPRTQRIQEFAGTVIKCPNCGEVVTQTTAVCPTCGMRITGQRNVSSVQRFGEELMAIEKQYYQDKNKRGIMKTLLENSKERADDVNRQKAALIKSFPVPNTIDEISEFMFLAVSNIDTEKSRKSFWNNRSSDQSDKMISDAWVAKMKQVYQKARFSFPDDPAFIKIQNIYFEKMKELNIKVK